MLLSSIWSCFSKSLHVLLRHVSLHLVVLPNVILVYPCAACCGMFRAALRTMCTPHGPPVEVRLASVSFPDWIDMLFAVNYLSVIPAMISIRELWWTLSWHFFHLVVFPNACMYILAQPVAPCMIRVALRPVCTAHGPLVEVGLSLFYSPTRLMFYLQ